MITQINSVAEGWWNWMWPMFWQVSALVVFLGAVDFLLRRHVWPQVRYALWLLVLVKLILPPAFSLSTSVVSQVWMLAGRTVVELSDTAMPAVLPAVLTSTEIIPLVASDSIEPARDRGVVMSSKPAETTGEIFSTSVGASIERFGLHWKVCAMGVWLAGVIILGLWAAVRFRKLRQLHSSKFSDADLPQWFGPLLTETANKLGLRKLPGIVISQKIASPAVFGTFRPVLLLPAATVHQLSRCRTEHILLHELAHIKRGDLTVNSFYTLLQILYWFNPLLWLLRRRLQHLRELCCDATVAGILRDKTMDYRETILQNAKWLLAGKARSGIGLLGLAEDSRNLLVRLNWLEKKTWKYRGLRYITICAAIALMSVFVLPMAKAKNADVLTVAADGSAEYSSIQKAIDVADAGAVIRIGPGMYEERLKIDKPLTLTGAGWDKTTIMTMSPGADVIEQAMRTLQGRMQEAKTDDHRNEIAAKFKIEFKEKHGRPTLLVSDTQGVVISDLKLTSPGERLEGRNISIPILEFSKAKASVSKCAVIGSLGDGIHILNGSDVEIRESLVAAVWSTGIIVGERQGASSSLRLLDSELRNCHYAGICIRKGNGSTRVERCRISGAAWHGIRYDDCSPAIVGNWIFGNARSGIYASGQTTATVRQNLFYANEMGGMSCWFQNQDTIEGNTFADNKQAGLSILGASEPVVQKNIFFSESNGVLCGDIGSDSAFAKSDGAVAMEKNLFWNNEHMVARRIAKTADSESTTEDIALDKQAGNLEMDPMFADAAGRDFSLMPDSPARRLGIGVAEPIGFESPWPIQPEEAAIIPDGPTRDYRKWKTPAQTTSSAKNSAVLGKREVTPVNPSDIALLYHSEPDVRIETITKLAASNDSGLIDDLIRAQSVENYTPVHNEYGQVLRSLTGKRDVRGKGAWKAWLVGEAKAGRLKIEYLPIHPDPNNQSKILPFALKGPGSFNQMAAILTAKVYDRRKCYDALRYMVFDDNLSEVQKFLVGDWLHELFSHQNININDIGYFLNGLANPGHLRGQINNQISNCLDSDNPIVVANALNLIAGVKGFSTRFTVPGVEKKVETLLSSSVPEVAVQAQRAIERIRPVEKTAQGTAAVEVKDGLHIKAFIDGKDTIKIKGDELWYEHHDWDLPGKWWDKGSNIKHDEPTYINGTAWKPEWQERVSKPYRLKRAVPLREANNLIKLAKITGRGSVSIAEKPQQANDYTLSILLDDSRYGRAQWYEFVIQWGAQDSQKQGPSLSSLGKSTGIEPGKPAPTATNDLQRMIDSAQPGGTVIIPKGVYTEPVTVGKPLTLKGESRNDCIFEVTSNRPAISVDSKGKGRIIIEAVTIKWQLATSERTEHPFAVAVKDTKAEVRNCCFQSLGNFKRCPVAINSMGFSELNIDTCRFEGFEYTVSFGQGTKGTIRNSLVMDSGHQGISLYSGATAEIVGNVVTGSKYHAVRSTGGNLNMTDNLIINNANRGVYLGNKSASGTISNNVIIGSGTGISGFAQSKVKIGNNIIADSSYAGIAMRDSCSLSIRDNILRGNERGLILFKEGSKNGNTVYKNTFWRNKIETENLDKTSDSIIADPAFIDAANGDFSLKPGPALQQKQGLKNPEIFKTLWKIWKNRQNKNMLSTEN